MKTWMRTLLGLSSAAALSACAPQGRSVERADEASIQTGIIGGSEVRSGSALTKSIVALYDSVQGQLCTGTLLPNNIVLTAAHCLSENPSDMVVIFGAKVDRSAQMRKVTGARSHENYLLRGNDLKDNGDIAVVRFEGRAPIGYVPAEILSDAKLLKNGASVLLAGYGISDGRGKTGGGTLRSVSVKIADAAYSETEVKLDQRQGRGACHGDSGGPAYVSIAGKNYVWGVTSRGVEDIFDLCNKFSVYTSIPAHRDWVQKMALELIRESSVLPVQRLAADL